MNEPMKKTSCQIACWAMGAGAGFVAFVMLWFLGEWTFIQSVFGASVIFILVGALLSWILCKPLPALGEVQAGMTELDDPAMPKAEAVSGTGATEASPAATATTTAAPTSATPAPTPAASAPVPDATPAVPATPKPEAAAAAAPAAVAPTEKAEPAAPATAASDAGMGQAAATDTQKPQTMSAARGGKADDLKQIRGIGPKLERMLHGMGFFHFDQIANWTDAELAWVDDNLNGFKGRASRDNWVDQARILADGGETAFSKRVDDGDVY